MAVEIWGVKLQDDVTATSDKMSHSLGDLQRDVTMLGKAFAATNAKPLVNSIKEARGMFNAAGQNIKLFKAGLKDAGVSALDSRLMLSKFNAELVHTRRVALGMNGIWSKVFDPKAIWVASHALNVASKSIGALRAVVGGVAGMIGGVGGTIFDYGKDFLTTVVHAAEQRQDTMMGLKYMFVEKKGMNEEEAQQRAKGMYSWSQRAAKKTVLSTPEVTNAMEQNFMAGFEEHESKILVKLMADTVTKFRGDVETRGKVQNLFTRLGGKTNAGRIDLRSMTLAHLGTESEIVEAASKMDVFKKIFAGLGKDATAVKKQAAFTKALSGGKVQSRDLLQAAINAQEKGGDAVGTFGESHGPASLHGAISNAEEAMQDLIKSTDSADWPGLVALRNMLNRITDAFDPMREEGHRTLETIKTVTDDLLGGMDKITQTDIDDFIKRLGDGAKEFSGWLKKGWDIVADFMHSDLSISSAAGDALLDAGIWIGQGILKGATTGASALAEERFARDHGGLSRSEAEYQAKIQGSGTPEDIIKEYDKHNRAFKAAGKTVVTPYGGVTAKAAYEQVMAMPLPAGPAVAEKPLTGLLADMGLDTGGAVGKGGGKAVFNAMYDVGTMGAEGLIEGARGPDGLDEHSPSRRMYEVGEMGAQGMIKGAEGGLGGTRGGGGWTGDLNIHVGAGGGDAAQQWEALRPTIQREVTQMFVGAVLEA